MAQVSKPRKVKTANKIIWRLFWIGTLAVFGVFAAAYFGAFGKMPSVEELQNPDADLASEIYSADGLLMGKYYSENRSEVKYHEISPNVFHALVATEDERFYDHSGIDAQAVGRSLATLGSQGGGSTITQQLAKMILKQGQGSMLQRGFQKIKEWIVAVELERNFTKDEILTMYLNKAPWGNVYGIRNASRTYFQKEPIDLKVEEAAVLVGMLKGFIYEPIRYPARSLERRNIVLNQMVVAKGHYLTPAEGKTLQAKPLITNYKKIDEAIGIAPHFRRALLDLLKPWIEKSRNPKTGAKYDLYRDGLKIYTTIDSRMQRYAEEATADHIPKIQAKLNSYLAYMKKIRKHDFFYGHDKTIEDAMKFSERWKTMKEEGIDEKAIRQSFNVPVKMKVFSWKGGDRHERDTVMTPLDSIKYHKLLLQSSFMAMDPVTGEVKCWVGGIDYRWFKYDHVTASRQVGSTFKPLLYTLGVTDAGYTPESELPGGALTLSGKTISGGGGTMAYCLSRSLNMGAWRLMSIIGPKRTVEFAHQAGITADIPNYPSIALGAAEIPLNQMLQSYTMFPNKGFNTPPVYVTRIEDKNGNLIYEFPLAQGKQLIGEADAYSMIKMMQGVISSGTARSLNSYKIPTEKAGKTGTTNSNTDGWFIGYTPELLAGSWVGCDDPFIPIYQNNVGGAEMSAPRWGMFMSKVYADKKLNYKKDKFDKPAVLQNDPIYADTRFEQIVNSGTGEDVSSDQGNGDASDYLDEGSSDWRSGSDTSGQNLAPTDPEPAAVKPQDPKSKDKQQTPATTIKQAAEDPKKKKPSTPQPEKNDY